MDKLKKWISKNKGLSILLLLTIVFVVFILIILVELLVGGSSNKYGNRLDGIDQVQISQSTYDSVKSEVMDSELASSVETRLQGKIVYTTITLNSDTSVDKAKELAFNTLDNYDEKELSFYDFSFFLKWENEEEGDTIITGSKHSSLDTITWVKVGE